MSTQVQWRKGTTAQHASFVGAPAECTIDTNKNTIVVHDGSTTGGFPVARSTGETFTGLVNLAAGANIASEATINLTAATGNCPRITGTVATSAVTMNTGQWELVVADGAWPLTYNATTNKINTGGLDYTCTAGDQILYHKDLSGVVHGIICQVHAVSKGHVRVNTSNGEGSTNTFTRRFTNVVANEGGDITYADSASLGGSFTVNMTGTYSISYSDQFNSAGSLGITINGNPATSVTAQSAAAIGAATTTISANNTGTAACTLKISAGSVVRAQTAGASAGTFVNGCQFTIARVG